MRHVGLEPCFEAVRKPRAHAGLPGVGVARRKQRRFSLSITSGAASECNCSALRSQHCDGLGADLPRLNQRFKSRWHVRPAHLRHGLCTIVGEQHASHGEGCALDAHDLVGHGVIERDGVAPPRMRIFILGSFNF